MGKNGGPTIRGGISLRILLPTLIAIMMFALPAVLAWKGLKDLEDLKLAGSGDPRALTAITDVQTVLSSVVADMVLMAVAGLSLAVLLTRRITRPARALADAARACSQGDLDVRVEEGGSDEISSLGKAFNNMASSLKMRTTALINEQSKLRSIHQSITDGIIVFGNNGFVTSANPAAEAMLDRTECTLAGRRETGIAELDELLEQPELVADDNMVRCWDVNDCERVECPSHGSDDLKCWQQCGTHCHDEIQGSFNQKRDACERCQVYRRNGCAERDVEIGGRSYSLSVVSILDDDGHPEGRLAVLHDMTDERHRSKQLKLLYEIATTIALTGDIGQSLKQSLEICIDAMNATSGSIMLIEEDGGLSIAAQKGLPEGTAAAFRQNVGEGIAGWVAERGEPLLITDDVPDPLGAGVKDISDAVCIPIKDENGIVGVLSLNEKKTGGGFTHGSLDFLGPVAVQIGMALSRARLHEKVAQEKEKSTAIVESMGESLCVRGPDREILFANDAHKEIFGEDCVGMHCYELYVGRDRICRGCPLDRCFDEGSTVRRSHFVLDRLGMRRQLETTASPVRDADGRISSCIEVSRDITEILQIRDQAESRLNTLTTLFQVSNTLSSSLELANIIDNFTASARGALNASTVTLLMFEGNKRDLIVKSIAGERNGWLAGEGDIIDIGNYSLNGLVSGVGPFCAAGPDHGHGGRGKSDANGGGDCGDGSDMAGELNPETVSLAPPDSQSILVGRLSSRGKLIGLIVVSSFQRGAFSEPGQMELFVDITNQAAVAIDNAEMYKRLEDTFWSTIRSLAEAIDAKDSYTRGHSDRVADYAEALARRLKLEDDMLNAVRCAGYLHDTGKIGIPDAILLKPGKLTDEEYNQIMSHPIMSHKIIEPVEFPYDVKPLVRHHHERMDGSGYPDGLSGDEIPLGARIIGIADAYEAMTSDRPYRKALTQAAATAELKRCAGTQFDAELVDEFLAVLAEDEIGLGSFCVND